MLPNNDRENENNARAFRKTDGDSMETLSGISLSGLTVEQALDLAFSYYDAGRLLEVEQLCRLVLQKVPRQVDAMQLFAALLSQRGQYTEAVQLLREAIRQAPGHAHIHNNLGIALHQLQKSHEAVSEFNKALQLRPDFAKAHNNLGVALMTLGRLDKAVTACRQAIHLQGDFKEAYNNLGLALKKKGEFGNAMASYAKAVNLDPEYAEALSNLGMVLIAQGRFEEAVGNLQKAVSLVPDSAEFRDNLGILFNRQGRFEEAVSVSEKAITMRPSCVEAHNNLGTALMELGRFSEANTSFEKAIAIDPECAEAHHNRSLVLLLKAQFEQGWDEYEWRWRHAGFSTPLRPFWQQWWNGSVEGVAKLLVWGEQGIGDEVQFSGLIRHILSQGIEVVVECDKRLVPLLQRSFPGVIVVKRSDPPAPLLKEASITHQIPMASIPRVLGLSPNSMGFQNPFMVPDEKQRERFRSEYKADIEIADSGQRIADSKSLNAKRYTLNAGNPVLVGISFRSGNSQEGQKRSIGLEHWGPILKVKGARFVNLQYGECSRQLQAAYERFGVEILKDERIDPLRDLESFAAQVAAMDVVISVDNSTVHFAGALGVEVWTMLPTVPDWRWGLEGDRTQWYPTMRLFRQAERGEWKPVISRVARELTSSINPDESR
ncbi:MAG: tetratricopeptide repeat protein [Planctomycetes bacterium]|nr:tetratricopeptide repeat protein [Planctomycetota bacterium]